MFDRNCCNCPECMQQQSGALRGAHHLVLSCTYGALAIKRNPVKSGLASFASLISTTPTQYIANAEYRVLCNSHAWIRLEA